MRSRLDKLAQLDRGAADNVMVPSDRGSGSVAGDSSGSDPLEEEEEPASSAGAGSESDSEPESELESSSDSDSDSDSESWFEVDGC